MPGSLVVSARTALKQLAQRWRFLIGSAPYFTLEARTFHSISIGLVFLSACYVPYNTFAGMYIAAFSALSLSIIIFYEYYRSRFMNRPYRSVMFGLIGLVTFTVNYFANAGIEGSTDIIWPVYLLLLLIISPYRQHLVWVITYIIVFALVHVAEYLYPGLVSYPFHYGRGRLLDRITAFPLPVIATYIVVNRFRKAYDRERAMVEQHDAEKSKLLSILSHDLRTPFIQIRQYLDLLDDPDIPATDHAQMAQTLRQTNNQTMELLTNMLYWSRSQLNGAAVNLVPLPVAETLQNTIAITSALTTQKNILFQHDIDTGITVIADADMLQLVVRNLLQNAVKFTPQGGIIHIEATTHTDTCRISITDSGTGIAPEQMNRLFSGNITPAYGTAHEKGVGLGLLLCRDFIERQNGRIFAKSTLGNGAVFTVELPLALA